jgi:hypothetical protein
MEATLSSLLPQVLSHDNAARQHAEAQLQVRGVRWALPCALGGRGAVEQRTHRSPRRLSCH